MIDVAAGHQPFSDESGDIWAVQNGEIYNHDDAPNASWSADGHRFGTRCDTEILPHLYEEHGETRFADRLHGMFAVAVWDGRARRGRPRPRPTRSQAALLRGARRAAPVRLGAEGAPRERPDRARARSDQPRALSDPRLGALPRDDPPRRLQAAARPPARRRRRRVAIAAVLGVPDRRRPVSRADVHEHVERLLESLRESVRLRLMSDVPLGAMLSGGLDSSLVVALMAEQMSEPVKTFAVGFAGSPASELADAREVAAFLGADHHELELDRRGRRAIDELVWHMDEPLADLSALGFIALCRLARQHVTVALSRAGRRRALRRIPAPSARADRPRLGSRSGRRRGAAPRARRRGRRRRAGSPRSPERATARRRPSSPSGSQTTASSSGSCGGMHGSDGAVGDRGLPGAEHRSAGRRSRDRRAAGVARRHAPLLRPRVDGALPRGARAVPRPSVRRAGGAAFRPT